MKAPTFLASAVYLATVLSFPLSDKSGGVKGLTDNYVNVTATDTPTQGFTKRQNAQTLASVMDSIGGFVNTLDTKGRVERDQFSSDLVTLLWNGNNHYNYIACHVAHTYNFQGQQGVDWNHQKVLPKSGYRYDVIVGGAGVFIRQGQGGSLNWGYYGYVASRLDAGQDAIVTFNAPPS